MKRRIALIVLLLVACAIVNIAVASTTNGDRQENDVRALKRMADLYFLDTGQYPITDSGNTWFQKLVAANYIWPENLLVSNLPDAPLPLDLFGRPLVYEVLNPKVPEAAVIRCIGIDGIDNQGAGDDLDSRFGPNLGYWNKHNWPRFYAFTFGGWLVAIMAGALVVFVWRRGLLAAGVFLLVGGVIVGIVVPILFGAGFLKSSATRLPEWGNVLSLWSCVLVPLGFGLASYAVARLMKVKRSRARRGLCPACAYPIGTSPVCTECGKMLAA
jgi:hypothetical protein